jgi:hypothetical protein
LGYRVEVENLVNASWGMLRLRDLLFDTVSALVAEFSEQQRVSRCKRRVPHRSCPISGGSTPRLVSRDGGASCLFHRLLE